MTDYQQELLNDQQSAQSVEEQTQPTQEPMHQRCEKQTLPVRRVGTITMGLMLILGGCVALVMLFVPHLDWLGIFKFIGPAVLILLGLEVVWFGSRQGKHRIKYDFLSMFTCMILLVAGMGCTIALPALEYYLQEQTVHERINWELQEQTYEQLKSAGVVDANFELYLSPLHINADMTVQDLQPGDLGMVQIQMGGQFGSQQEFAQACASVLKVLQGYDLKPAQVLLEGNGTVPDSRYSLWRSGRYAMGSTAQELEQDVSYEAPAQPEPETTMESAQPEEPSEFQE